MAKYIKKSFAPHIYQDWIHLFRQCSPEQRSELLLAITDFPNYEPEIEIPIWDFIKSQLDVQYQTMKNKSQTMSDNRNNKKQNPTEADQSRPKSTEVDRSSQIEIETGIEIETRTGKNMCEANPFCSLTSDTEIHNALSDPESSLNFFLTIGEGYDELSSKEREFVDRGDVRSKCPWVKELQKARQFIAPTLEQVLEYARQQNSIAMCGGFACSEQVAEEFWSHYESQDWRISNESNTPIRDWKPKLRQWCLREKKQQNQQKQFTPRMSLKEMKEMQNEIEVQKILKGER